MTLCFAFFFFFSPSFEVLNAEDKNPNFIHKKLHVEWWSKLIFFSAELKADNSIL